LRILDYIAPHGGLVESGAYDGSTFYRSTTLGVPNAPRLIQGGPLGDVLAPTGEGRTSSAKRFDLLEDFETTADSKLSHTTGTLSLSEQVRIRGIALHA
jgi:hypothetical protein